MEKSLNPKNAAEQVHDTFRKTAAQFEELARESRDALSVLKALRGSGGT